MTESGSSDTSATPSVTITANTTLSENGGSNNIATDISTVEVRVTADSDDAEEYVSTGVMYLDSTDLELISEPPDQEVGMRFLNLTIPQGGHHYQRVH